MPVLEWQSDQFDIPEEWLILSTMPEKDTGKGLSTTVWTNFQLLVAAQIKSHMNLSFEHTISIPPMIDALIDGVTTTLLQVRCGRQGLLPPRQKQYKYDIADQVNFS
jgi:hypothetical protein